MISVGHRQNESQNIAWVIDSDNTPGTLNVSVSAPRGMGWEYVIEQLKEAVSEHFDEQIDEHFNNRKEQ